MKQNVESSIKSADYNNNENEMITEKAKFMQIIQTHHNYLVELKQQRSSKLLRDHRNKILSTVHSQLYCAFLEKTITYKEFKTCLDYARDMFSWERITGVKQLSIFDDVLPLNNE